MPNVVEQPNAAARGRVTFAVCVRCVTISLERSMRRELEIRFVSRNVSKFAEAQKILAPAGVTVKTTKAEIHELQTNDINRLVRDKVLKAYETIGRPLFVEHTGLALKHLSGLPGGLTQVFWDTLEAERFAKIFGELAPEKDAVATTHIAYCDGRRIYTFEGSIAGTIVPEPRGVRTFQWDCVFQPNGHTETFAEMGDRKNEISMRRMALDKFRMHLEST